MVTRRRLVVSGYVYDDVPEGVLYLAQLVAQGARRVARVVVMMDDGTEVGIDPTVPYCWNCGVELDPSDFLYCPECDRAMQQW